MAVQPSGTHSQKNRLPQAMGKERERRREAGRRREKTLSVTVPPSHSLYLGIQFCHPWKFDGGTADHWRRRRVRILLLRADDDGKRREGKVRASAAAAAN